ncbi:MAG: hypothetical protein DHS20C21_17760 [Gemmatimonadota bacterium]|nr:MAG: hypothetical protein DHS20C21_17760 [Gemmatimonadota bacterium]
MLAYLVWNALYFLSFTVDDAFISFRYARNLAEGLGPVYNPGERVEGFSSFSYVMLAAAFLRLGMPLLLSMKVFGLACAVGVALASHQLCRRLFAPAPWAPHAALLCLALICMHTSLALWSQAGLETVFFSLLIVLSVWRFEVERDGGRAPWSAVLVWLLVITRPEAPLYLAYFALRFFGARRNPGVVKDALLWLGVLLVLVPAYEWWGWSYYGAWLPNTHAAKVGAASLGPAGDGESFRGARYLLGFLKDHGWGFWVLLGLGAAGAVIPGPAPRDVRRPLAIYAPVLSGLAFVYYAGADWMPRHRFFVPFLPLLLAAVSFGVFRLRSSVRARRSLALPLLLVTAVSVGHYAYSQSFGSAESTSKRKGHEARAARGWWPAQVPERVTHVRYPFATLAVEATTTVRTGEWISLPDIGFVGYLTDNPVWDQLGLVTVAAARARNNAADDGFQAAIDDLLSRDPAMIVERSATGAAFLNSFYAALRRDPRMRERYETDGPFEPFYPRVHRRRGAEDFDAQGQLDWALSRLENPGTLRDDGGLVPLGTGPTARGNRE